MVDWTALRQLAVSSRAVMPARLALTIAGQQVGSIAPSDAALLGLSIGQAGFELNANRAERDAQLASFAQRLNTAGRIKSWRDELLPVCALDAPGFAPALANVERGAARILGVLTHAVHLIGFAASGDIWLQLRAATKRTDPGLWDTLAGGLVSAGDTLHTGVLRETHEEAGLLPAQLLGLQAHGGLRVEKTVPEGQMVERAWAYSATLSADAKPHNLDGEVAEFACLPRSQVQALIAGKQLTQEAALTLALVWGELAAEWAAP